MLDNGPRRLDSSDSSTIHPKYPVHRVIPADDPRIVPFVVCFFIIIQPHFDYQETLYIISWAETLFDKVNLLLIMNRCPFVSAAPRKPVSFSKLNAPWQLLNALASAQFRNCLRLRSSLQAFSNLYNILSPLVSSFILCLIQFTGKSSNMPELKIFGLQFCAEHPWGKKKNLRF